MEDDTKLIVSRTREDGSNEVIYEIRLAELYELQQACPYTTLSHQARVDVGEYTLAISIGKFG